MKELEIVPATAADVPAILSLIRELADYEKLLHEVVATEELVTRALFAPKPVAECLIARYQGAVAGFALFFHNYSTFLARLPSGRKRQISSVWSSTTAR